MARNKYPEQTVERILSISTKLFFERGYDKTTIQDILDELKMSKGAIYHHFKSKEEIFDAISRKRDLDAQQFFNCVINNTKGENAKEKIKKIISALIADSADSTIDTILSSQIVNPQFVVSGIQSSVLNDAGIFSKLFIEGIADGSIQTDYPLACAEIFLLLFNFWLNPVLFNRNAQETKQRLKFLQQCMNQLGVDIISDEVIEQVIEGHKSRKAFT